MNKTIQHIVIIICFIGLLNAAYLLNLHYILIEDTGYQAFCNVNEYFTCNEVNAGKYSTFIGIPVALLGIVGYLFIGGLAWFRRNKWKTGFPFIDKRQGLWHLIIVSIGLIFSAYLTFLELFVIHKMCLLCLLSAVIMVILFLLILKEY